MEDVMKKTMVMVFLFCFYLLAESAGDTVFVNDTFSPVRMYYPCCDTTALTIKLNAYVPNNSGFRTYCFSKDTFYWGITKYDLGRCQPMSYLREDTPNTKRTFFGYSKVGGSLWFFPNKGNTATTPITLALTRDTVFYLKTAATIINSGSLFVFKPFDIDSGTTAGWRVFIRSGRPRVDPKELKFGETDTLRTGDSIKIMRTGTPKYSYLFLLDPIKTGGVVTRNIAAHSPTIRSAGTVRKDIDLIGRTVKKIPGTTSLIIKDGRLLVKIR
jgi:hypothetical protein